MAWIAPAIGAGTSIIGGALSGGAPQAHPEKDARNNFKSQNPNSSTPWGNTKSWVTGKLKDQQFHTATEMSPEMEALQNALLGRAGASRGTYDSGGMSEGARDVLGQRTWQASLSPQERDAYNNDRRNAMSNMDKSTGSYQGRTYGENRIMGQGYFDPNEHQIETGGEGVPQMPTGDDFERYKPQRAQYDRPEFGFGVGDGAVQLGEGGNTFEEGMTDMEAYNWLTQDGKHLDFGIDNKDQQWLEEYLGGTPESPYIQSDKFSWDEFGQGNDLNEQNMGRIRELRSAFEEYSPYLQGMEAPQMPPGGMAPGAIPPGGMPTQLPAGDMPQQLPTEAPPQNFDPDAMQELIAAMSAI